jgi:DNA-binding LacI/PurR family transcriptional regulator
VTGHIQQANATPKSNGDRSPSVHIRDVARAAGVSHQTVSRVINASPGVSAATREAVLATIARLGFRPNRAARALAGGPIQSVTVLGSNTSLYGFAAALEGIEEATREVGFGMGFRALEALSPADMCDAVERAVEPAGALIVIAFDRAGVLALECVPPDVPTVAMIQAPIGATVPIRPSVWIDEFSAAKEATEYLLALGHKTVHHLPIPSWSGPTRRMLGWRAALKKAGVRAPRPLRGGWTSEWGYDAGCKLAKDPAVTAVLCGNDDIALGAMRAMHEAGRAVPADVSVIGFDDIPYARFFSPALTTVRQDFKTLGKVCFTRLLELSGSSSPLPELASPQAQLIIRESVGPPPESPSGSRARSSPATVLLPTERPAEALPTHIDSAGARSATGAKPGTVQEGA